MLMSLLTDLPYLPLVPQLLMLIYTVAYRPYKEKIENLRSAFNYLCMMVASSLLVFNYFVDESTKMSWAGYMYPIILLTMLFGSIAWASVIVVQDLYKYRHRCERFESYENKLSYKMFNDQQMVMKFEEEIVQSDMFKAKTILNSMKPKELSQYQSEKLKDKNEPKKQNGLKDQNEPKEANESKEQNEAMEKKKAKDKPISIKEEEDLIKWLKQKNLPNSHEAVEILLNSTDFIHYQNAVWMKKEEHLKRLDTGQRKVYEEI